MEQVGVDLGLPVPVPPGPVEADHDFVASEPLEEGGVGAATWKRAGRKMNVGGVPGRLCPLREIRAEGRPDAAMKGVAGVGVFAFEVDDLAGMGRQDRARLIDAVGAAAIGKVECPRTQQVRLLNPSDCGNVDTGVGQPFEPFPGVVGADHAYEADVHAPQAHADSCVDGVAAQLPRGDPPVWGYYVIQRAVSHRQKWTRPSLCFGLVLRHMPISLTGIFQFCTLIQVGLLSGGGVHSDPHSQHGFAE